jgi:hypothetical protein
MLCTELIACVSDASATQLFRVCSISQDYSLPLTQCSLESTCTKSQSRNASGSQNSDALSCTAVQCVLIGCTQSAAAVVIGTAMISADSCRNVEAMCV